MKYTVTHQTLASDGGGNGIFGVRASSSAQLMTSVSEASQIINFEFEAIKRANGPSLNATEVDVDRTESMIAIAQMQTIRRIMMCQSLFCVQIFRHRLGNSWRALADLANVSETTTITPLHSRRR